MCRSMSRRQAQKFSDRQTHKLKTREVAGKGKHLRTQVVEREFRVGFKFGLEG
jgi:hypothetical protein